MEFVPAVLYVELNCTILVVKVIFGWVSELCDSLGDGLVECRFQESNKGSVVISRLILVEFEVDEEICRGLIPLLEAFEVCLCDITL